MILRSPRCTLFPYTTLFRSGEVLLSALQALSPGVPVLALEGWGALLVLVYTANRALRAPAREGDRKSTRLNSSHTVISYAVFCLKKKKKKYRGLRQGGDVTA